MLRENIIKTSLGKDAAFRWRGHEISRVEGLSDAVFGFAVTLLVVSLEVPKTFDELAEIMRGFGAFAISFALLFGVWFQHYKFFRRYGLQDTTTVVLSGVLLFVVLFYVYPLKFLFSTLVDRLMGGHGEVRLPNGNVEAAMEPSQIGSLMIVFGVGYLAVFAVFFCLFWHAYRKRKELELNEFEVFDTRNSLQEMALHCGIALLSLTTVVVGGSEYASLSGTIYMLTGVAMGMNGTIMGRRRRRMARLLTALEE